MKVKLNVELLQDYMVKNKMSVKDFCKFCDVSVSTYRNLCKTRNCRFRTLYNIAKNTHLSCDDLLGINQTN